jgi:subtilisin family serine protease
VTTTTVDRSASATTTTVAAPTTTVAPADCVDDFSSSGAASAGSAAAPLDGAELDAATSAAIAASDDGTVVVTATDESGRPEFRTVAADPAAVSSAVDAADGDVVGVDAPQPAAIATVADDTSTAGVDPMRVDQWGLDYAAFPAVWDCGTGAGVTVAVIDTGVMATHLDLLGRVVSGPSYLNNTGVAVAGGGGTDEHGHGTHVAGTVAALAGNGLGGRGAASDVSIYAVRVMGPTGSGYSSDVARGITAAVDADVDVINLSLTVGSSGPNDVKAALAYAAEQGVVVVAASGNSSSSCSPCWPAASPDVIAVANHAKNGAIAASSVQGSYVDVAAPGEWIGSTVIVPRYNHAVVPPAPIYDGYGLKSGTSMASPHVAALAALIIAADPDVSPSDVRAAINAGTVDAGDPGVDDAFGYGRINAAATWEAYR